MTTTTPRAKMIDWVEEYLDVGIQSTAESTRRVPRSVLIPFAEWYDKTRKHPRHVSQDDLVRFFLREAPFVGKIVGRTHNHYRRYLRTFLTWAMKTERLKTQMSLLEAVDRRGTTRRDFTKIDRAGLAEMIDGCQDPRDKALLAATTYNCARGSEVRVLRIRDVDLDAGVIHWTNVKKGRPVQKDIVRQLDPPLRAWMELYLSGALRMIDAPADPNEWFAFPRRQRHPLAGGGTGWSYLPGKPIADVNSVVQRYTAPAIGDSVGEGGPHTLRRSGALAIELSLIEDGVDAGTARAVAQAMCDHESPETTDLYTGNSMQKMLARSLLQGRDILPDLNNVTRLRSVDGRDQAV